MPCSWLREAIGSVSGPDYRFQNMLRLGLVCIFREEPIRFRRLTARNLSSLNRQQQLEKISEICLFNSSSLQQALLYCSRHGIGALRVNSQILPLKTHPEIGYDMPKLPAAAQIMEQFRLCGTFAVNNDIRTSFHPDQFVLLSSPHELVTERSVAELIYQSEVAEWINADVINIHAGGSYGNKQAALERLKLNLDLLPQQVKSRLTLENDDLIYTPADLLPLCREKHIPLVYDIHHHRCLPDNFTEEEATALALETWNREPLFHLSSPRHGWHNPGCRLHHDYIDPEDFPELWKQLDVTVEIEAKAKELAVLRLAEYLKQT